MEASESEEPFDWAGGGVARLSGWVGLVGVPLLFVEILVSLGGKDDVWFDPLVLSMFLGGAALLVGFGYGSFWLERMTARPTFNDAGIRLLNPKFLGLRNSIRLQWSEIAACRVEPVPPRRDRGFFGRFSQAKIMIVRRDGPPLPVAVLAEAEWSKSASTFATAKLGNLIP